MANKRALLVFAAAALAATACRRTGSDPVPASLPGTYVYAAKGSTFKKPWEVSARIALTPDKHFRFTMDKAFEGSRDSTETSVGTYSVDGDHILLSEGEEPGPSHEVHKLLIKADSLIAEVGWTAELFIKGVGAPNVVFVKQRTS